MRTKNILMVLSFVVGTTCAAVERAPASMTAANWSSSNTSVVVASTSTHTMDSGQSTGSHSSVSATAEDDRSEESNSNIRLMLIGVLLIGVVALRGRKNLS